MLGRWHKFCCICTVGIGKLKSAPECCVLWNCFSFWMINRATIKKNIALILSLFENTYNFSQILQVCFCVAERWWRGIRDCMWNQFYKLTNHSGLICKENVFLSVNWIGLCTFLVGNFPFWSFKSFLYFKQSLASSWTKLLFNMWWGVLQEFSCRPITVFSLKITEYSDLIYL